MANTKATPRLSDPADTFQRDVRTIMKGFEKNPLLRGQLIESQAIGTSVTAVSHGLGRIPTGWIVVDNTASATIYRDTSKTTERNKYLYLKASASTTVSLWVF